MTCEIPLSGARGAGRVALVDDEDFERVSGRRWYLHPDGYAVANGGVYMHRLVLGIVGAPHTVIADHINHDRLDNRRANLRVCTHAQNLAHRRRAPGVRREGRGWVAYVGGHDVRVRIGPYASEAAAKGARNVVARSMYGEYAPQLEGAVLDPSQRLTRPQPAQRASCAACGRELSRKAAFPSEVKRRSGRPPLCVRCHCNEMNAIRHHHAGGGGDSRQDRESAGSRENTPAISRD